MKSFVLTIAIILLLIIQDLNAQCPPSKYGIVPVWPEGWSQIEKENWYQTMSDKGMGYLHSIYTWQELATIIQSGQLPLHINYLRQLKESHNFTLHLLLRNPSITYNAIPAAYSGLTFEDSILVDAFYDFSVELIDAFAPLTDYLTIGGEADVYFEMHPDELENYVHVLSEIADYIHHYYPSIKFATTVTLNHGEPRSQHAS